MGAMRITSLRIGLILAALNVLLFIAMLATRETAYKRLAELDAFSRSGSSGDYSSAEPWYLAGRPFYSPAHYGNVPLAETVFFAANLPADLGALLLEGAVWQAWYWFEGQSLSWAQRSWVTAGCFMTLAGLWAFLVGAASHRLVRWSGLVPVKSRNTERDKEALGSQKSRVGRLFWALVVVGVCLAVWKPVFLLPLVLPGFLLLEMDTFVPLSISMEVHYGGFGPDGGPSSTSIAWLVLMSAVGWAVLAIPAFWFQSRSRRRLRQSTRTAL